MEAIKKGLIYLARRRLIQKNLIRASNAAYLAAIELHNKPNMPYRYETVSLLLINAWELILKAYVRKYIKGKSIFEKDGHTISFGKALENCTVFINTHYGKNKFTPTMKNLKLLEQYRNVDAHFFNDDLDPVIFSLIAKAALNYTEFLETYFGIDILADDGLFILPLGFKLPFRPTDFLSKKASSSSNFPETKEFINKVVQVITDLKNEGIEESVVLGYGVYLESVKKATNSDILAALTSPNEAEVRIAKSTKIIPTRDPGAQKVYLSEDQLNDLYPYSYDDIVQNCRKRYDGYSMNQFFWDLMKKVKQDPSMSFGRRLNPKGKGEPDKYLYSEEVFKYLDTIYTLSQ